jgi:hypothetical protein
VIETASSMRYLKALQSLLGFEFLKTCTISEQTELVLMLHSFWFHVLLAMSEKPSIDHSLRFRE